MQFTAAQIVTLGAPIAVIASAGVAAFAGYVTASLKLRELRLADQLRTRDAHLGNARKVAAEVYVPLAIAIAQLGRAYGQFRLRIDFDGTETPIGAIRRFKGACNAFEAVWNGLLERGASAYLTMPLEEEIADFALFLQESLDAQMVIRKITLTPRFYGAWMPKIELSEGRSLLLLGFLAKLVNVTARVISPVGSVELKSEEEIVASPITSRDFESRFQESILEISALIKEVTLGGRLDDS